jgi:hypothetical protein
VTTRFETLGFDPAYTVEVDPRIPANGIREYESYAYGRNGRRINDFDFDSRWGTPLMLRVTSHLGESWIAAFAAGGLGVVRNVYACPSPDQLCAVVDGLAYLVDVNAPDEPAVIAANAVVHVLAIKDVPLLLLASDTDLAGVGADGAFWSAPRVVVNDLRVIRASAEAIVCSGDVGGRMATITVTPESGVVWGADYR